MLRTPARELSFLSIADAARLLRKKKISPLELVDAAIAQIERWDPQVNAFITVLADQARRSARRAEREFGRNKACHPLCGIPITLKDNIYTKGIRTTAGSKILSAFLPAVDSSIASRLHRAGAILLGKTNLHEFAYGISSENPHFGPARNPWAGKRITGGSSGGSAAAVATGMGFASVGTDTAGSIRVPPALCGVVGFKPTSGLVSLDGVVPLSKTCDHAGFIARSVGDVRILLQTLAGAYPKGSKRLQPVALRNDRPRRPRLGWPQQHFFDSVESEVRARIDEAMEVFRQAGAKVEQISMPRVAESVAAGTAIQMAEATWYHQSQNFFPRRAHDYGADVRERLESGLRVKATDYLQALDTKRGIEAEFDEAFQAVDAIVAPASPVPAPEIGENDIELAGKRQALRGLLVGVNRPANVSGNPALSIPCGFTSAGLPVGLQLIGPRFGEAGLLAIAQIYEDATDWHRRHPE